MAKGYLIVNVYSGSVANPVRGASVVISKNGRDLMTTLTNENGQTEKITLDTVDKDYSMEDQKEVRPYETYDLLVSSLGLTNVKLEGVQIFDEITSIQNVYLASIDEEIIDKVEEITPNTLWGDYPPNTALDQENESGIAPIVIKQVIVPKNIVVHDGIPSNNNAPNYVVPFIDYIKNVASSEIYSTWKEETIKANVLAIISFTLNRIFTEWYPSRGYDFTITSSTSYDQKYTRNGTIFEPISNVVDEIFANYIRYGIRTEPLLAHYKSDTKEEGYLSQWGSKTLGDRGYTALEILRYYYGNSINIYEAAVDEDYPYSFKRRLELGDCSEDVYILQNTLNYIRGSYPGIPVISNPTGYFDQETKNAVLTFQKVFSLLETGEVNYQTWYKLSYILTAVSDMASSVYS